MKKDYYVRTLCPAGQYVSELLDTIPFIVHESKGGGSTNDDFGPMTLAEAKVYIRLLIANEINILKDVLKKANQVKQKATPKSQLT